MFVRRRAQPRGRIDSTLRIAGAVARGPLANLGRSERDDESDAIPVVRFSTVDLPRPDGPTTETIYPVSTRRSMPRTAAYSRLQVR